MIHKALRPNPAVNPLDEAATRAASLLRRINWYRVVVLFEMAVLVVFAVALTVAPQATLSTVAGLFEEARDASLANRPLIAFLGLLTLGLTLSVFRALLGHIPGAPLGQTPQSTNSRSEAQHRQ